MSRQTHPNKTVVATANAAATLKSFDEIMKKYLIAIVSIVLASVSLVQAEGKADPLVIAETTIVGEKQTSSVIKIGEISTWSIGKEKDILDTEMFFGKILTIKPASNLDGSHKALVTYVVSGEPKLKVKTGVVTQASEKKVFVVPIDDKERTIQLGEGKTILIKLYLVDMTGKKI